MELDLFFTVATAASSGIAFTLALVAPTSAIYNLSMKVLTMISIGASSFCPVVAFRPIYVCTKAQGNLHYLGGLGNLLLDWHKGIDPPAQRRILNGFSSEVTLSEGANCGAFQSCISF